MSHIDNVIDIRRPVEFTIDGCAYETTARRWRAADLLVLAGLDPILYDLGELRAHRQQPVRYQHTDIVQVHRGTRFVSIRDRADVV